MRERDRLFQRDRAEDYLVAGLQLAKFPEFAARHDRGTDEPAKARTVGSQNDRHVAGEIDRADGVGVVVNVGGMQACLAAVGARPLRRLGPIRRTPVRALLKWTS